ncbi:MAG: hypothetical protein JWP37_68 [Mucilaginibacter sp.]|nr:hypothetical protein [Mucilaginibacter sp.]
MMDISIKNINDLKAEIIRLRVIEQQQSEGLKARVSSPSALFHTAISLFPKSSSPGDDSKNSIFNQDFFGILSRVLLPLTLNKTLFRNSNFVVKALVGFLSQKASHFISEDSVTGLISKVKSIFEKKNKKTDYGIPPDSETY